MENTTLDALIQHEKDAKHQHQPFTGNWDGLYALNHRLTKVAAAMASNEDPTQPAIISKALFQLATVALRLLEDLNLPIIVPRIPPAKQLEVKPRPSDPGQVDISQHPNVPTLGSPDAN